MLCFKLDWSLPYDDEAVWAFVQAHWGRLSVRPGVTVFWIPREYASLLLLKWPGLMRAPALDYK